MASTPLWVQKTISEVAHFRIQDAGIFTYNTAGQVSRLANFGFKNSGKNTAKVTETILVALDTGLNPLKPVVIRKSLQEEFEPGHDFTVSLPIVSMNDNAAPALFFLKIEYEDAITRRRMTQSFFHKWGGAKNGVFVANFGLPTKEERNTLTDIIKGLSITP